MGTLMVNGNCDTAGLMISSGKLHIQAVCVGREVQGCALLCREGMVCMCECWGGGGEFCSNYIFIAFVNCIMNVVYVSVKRQAMDRSGAPHGSFVASTLGPKLWMCLGNNFLAVQVTHMVQLFE